MIIPVILAGGSGTRLWPLSRELQPKQLLGLVNTNTMIQNTYTRLRDHGEMGAPIIICGDEHRFMVAEQFRQMEETPQSIILEPVGRNTAPALAVAALKGPAKAIKHIERVINHKLRTQKQPAATGSTAKQAHS